MDLTIQAETFPSWTLQCKMFCMYRVFPKKKKQKWLTQFVPQTRLSRFWRVVASARRQETFVCDGYLRFCAPVVEWESLVNNRGFPFKGNNSGTHFRNYNVFGARKPCRIDDLLPLNFGTQMVSPIQNILTKNLETICRVILAKTSQKMIMNLLMMVLIYLPICQHHVSGYVCHVWHLRCFFFQILIEIISIAKLLIIVRFLVWKYEKQTLSYIHTKF